MIELKKNLEQSLAAALVASIVGLGIGQVVLWKAFFAKWRARQVHHPSR